MIKIKFKKMEILDDEVTVKITGEYKDKEIDIELSVLQLTKVFRCDKKVLKELEECGFGSEELEDKCKEIREIIKKFPNVKISANEINCGKVLIRNGSRDFVRLFGENLCGWGNEGIMIKFPLDLYREDFEGKEFDFILRQDSIELREIEEIKSYKRHPPHPIVEDMKKHPHYENLKGLKLHLKEWTEYQKGWSHDHCEICMREISNIKDDPDVDNEGYTDKENANWICKSCFKKYKKEFAWTEG